MSLPPDRRVDLKVVRVPTPLRDLPAWLVWNLEQYEGESKPHKVPYSVRGGRRHGKHGCAEDRGRLTTFAIARDDAIRRGMTGVGFAPLEGEDVIALDFDKCVVEGRVDPLVLELVQGTYAEYSPSGTGIRAFFRGPPHLVGNRKSPAREDLFGIETFSSSGFVTVTGWALDHVELLGLEDKVAPLPEKVIEYCTERFGPQAMKPVDPNDFMLGHEPRLGLEIEEMDELLGQLDPDMSRDEWIRVGMALHHETEGYDTGFYLWNDWSSNGGKYPSEEALRRQWESFERRKGQRRRQVTMATVKRMVKQALEGGNEKWEEPSPLPRSLPPVPPMTADMLPGELAPCLIDISERMNVPLDFVAIPAMVMLGSLIGRKVSVRPEQYTDWSEPANLWGVVIASPGALKTPAVNEVFAPIRELEREAQEQNKRALEQHQKDQLIHKSTREAALARAKKSGGAATDFEQALMCLAVEPERPRLKRFMTSDATVEKLGEICADNPNGVLYHRDELPTMLLDLQRDEKAVARGFLLTGWTGMEGYTFDRIGRGTIRVEAVNISLFGTAQPQRISSIISTSSARLDDGMVQRLQLAAWPDLPETWVPTDRRPDTVARLEAFECCNRLGGFTAEAVDAQCEAKGMPYLRFSAAGRERFVEYRAGLEAKLRDGSLPAPLASHLAKFRGLIPRIALVLHLAGGGTSEVSEAAVRAALAWAHYLEAHARRMYSADESNTTDTAQLILERIENGSLADGFSRRDIMQKGWSGLRDHTEVARALRTLVNHGWLRRETIQTKGRPRDAFLINPAAKRADSD